MIAPRLFCTFLVCLAHVAVPAISAQVVEEPADVASKASKAYLGDWDANLISPGGQLHFGMQVNETEKGELAACITNGPEKIDVPEVKITDKGFLQLLFSHYDSKLTFQVSPDDPRKLIGHWNKRKGVNEWSEMKAVASKTTEARIESTKALKSYLGRFSVKFKSEPEVPSVAVFKLSKAKNRIVGTFMTTTGDYRYLDGVAEPDGKLRLACFDGAHAFLFRVESHVDPAEMINGSKVRANLFARKFEGLHPIDEANLVGDFWSSESYHDVWTAVRDPKAKLPDAFAETKLVNDKSWGDYKFPDLEGNLTSLNDPKFQGKARIIYVFGSWCPNCHDAGKYMTELKEKYGDKGLSILGLAFEHTGEHDRDSRQVKRYLKRNGAQYDVLLAGLSDKKKASQAIPFLDRVRSYPTTLFIDSKGVVRAIHTGFTGPATGSAYEDLRRKFESQIESLLAE